MVKNNFYSVMRKGLKAINRFISKNRPKYQRINSNTVLSKLSAVVDDKF